MPLVSPKSSQQRLKKPVKSISQPARSLRSSLKQAPETKEVKATKTVLPKKIQKTKEPLVSKAVPSPEKEHSKIVIIDFGSQYTQVIARRVRECHVFSEILPHTTKASTLAADKTIRGIIFSGGPASVYAAQAPQVDKDLYNLGLPLLGICYGMQLLTQDLGGV